MDPDGLIYIAKWALTELDRLEAATSRLEDMVPTIGEESAPRNGLPPVQDQGLSFHTDLARGASPPAPQNVERLPAAIEAYDAMINKDVKTYVNMSEEIGGLVAEQVGGDA